MEHLNTIYGTSWNTIYPRKCCIPRYVSNRPYLDNFATRKKSVKFSMTNTSEKKKNETFSMNKKNITKYYVSNEQLYPKDETLIRLYQTVSQWIILMAVFGLKNEIIIKLKPLVLFTRPVILHMAEKITANFSFSTNFASFLDKDGLF